MISNLKLFKLFSIYFLLALVAISAVTTGLDLALAIDLPAGLNVIAAPFVGAFFLAARHARATERPLTSSERFGASIVFSAATIFVSLSCLLILFGLNFLKNPGSTGRLIKEILNDQDGWYAALTLVYLFFIAIMTPAVAKAYSFFYARALKKRGRR